MKKLKFLKTFLIENVNPIKVFSDCLDIPEEDLQGRTEYPAFCPFHPDDKGGTKSFSINLSTGDFYCHSCNERGTNIVNFYEKYHNINFQKALKGLYHNYIRPTIPYYKVQDLALALPGVPSMVKYITQVRKVSKKVMEDRALGFDGNSITIPIFNQYGFCINIRRYNSDRKPKMLSWEEGYGENSIYLLDNLIGSKSIILCEGEWDALVLESNGFKAVTRTGGAKTWTTKFNEFFVGKDVYLCFDNDEPGKEGLRIVTKELQDIAKSIKIITLPLEFEGADISDFFQRGGTAQDFQKLIDAAELVAINPKYNGTQLDTEFKQVSLFQASEAKFYYQKVKLKARVSGKEVLPYYIPRKVKITCHNFEEHDCFCHEKKVKTTEFLVDPWDKNILRLINVSDVQRDAHLRTMFGVTNTCHSSVEVVEQYNAEQIRLTPDVNFSDTGQFVARKGFYIGHGIESNKSYEFEGYSAPDPTTQQVTHILVNYQASDSNLDSFKLDSKIVNRLKLFRPPQPTAEGIMDHFKKIANWQSENITKIRKRDDLHILTDLTFCSVDSFHFNSELVKKGMIETLVLGDSRCGKGAVVEGLSRYYGLGKMASGENCSYAGLVGGVQPIGRTFMITWGLIPEQNRGLYVIDEVSSMAPEDIGKMSRVRSEGIAEITKIITEKTWSKARGIWISNTRSGKDISTYNNGVEAVVELMGNLEDVSRFDMAIIVSKNEVSDHTINSHMTMRTDPSEFTSDDFRNIVLWAWSRKPDQIKFTPKATNLILEESIRLGRKYSSSIPLIQSENIRIKLAKISAAVAAKCFSCYNDGEGILIKTTHVQVSIDFLERLYCKPNFGYDTFSKSKNSQDHLRNEVQINDLMRSIGHLESFVEGMLDQKRISLIDISDFIAKDKFDAKELVGKLVRLRCLQKENTYYVKKPAFISYLRNLEKKKYIIEN